MNCKYLLRIDDVCPTMNWDQWQGVEDVLLETDVKPLLAVIPDNRDPHLMVGPAHPGFWNRVREWQSWGWAIGLHGYQHRYVTQNAGIIGLNPYSEFAGVPAAEQQDNLARAFEILSREGVRPDAFVAPAHSFDENTVRALAKLGLNVISDGLAVLPYVQDGTLWIPQQLWRFRPMPFGIWTVCVHLADPAYQDLAALRLNLLRFREQMTTFQEVAGAYRCRRRGVFDFMFESSFRFSRRARAWNNRPSSVVLPAAHLPLEGTKSQAGTAGSH